MASQEHGDIRKMFYEGAYLSPFFMPAKQHRPRK